MNKLPSIRFQQYEIHSLPNMIYWFKCGEIEFDIRDLRSALGLKIDLSCDTNFQLHPCTRMKQMFHRIFGAIGQNDFLKSIGNNGEQSIENNI